MGIEKQKGLMKWEKFEEFLSIIKTNIENFLMISNTPNIK